MMSFMLSFHPFPILEITNWRVVVTALPQQDIEYPTQFGRVMDYEITQFSGVSRLVAIFVTAGTGTVINSRALFDWTEKSLGQRHIQYVPNCDKTHMRKTVRVWIKYKLVAIDRCFNLLDNAVSIKRITTFTLYFNVSKNVQEKGLIILKLSSGFLYHVPTFFLQLKAIN